MEVETRTRGKRTETVVDILLPTKSLSPWYDAVTNQDSVIVVYCCNHHCYTHLSNSIRQFFVLDESTKNVIAPLSSNNLHVVSLLMSPKFLAEKFIDIPFRSSDFIFALMDSILVCYMTSSICSLCSLRSSTSLLITLAVLSRAGFSSYNCCSPSMGKYFIADP